MHSFCEIICSTLRRQVLKFFFFLVTSQQVATEQPCMKWNSLRKTKLINELGKNVTRFSLLGDGGEFPLHLPKTGSFFPTGKIPSNLGIWRSLFLIKHWLTLLQINHKILHHNICNFFRSICIVLIVQSCICTYCNSNF